MSLSGFLKARTARGEKYGQLGEDETYWVAECVSRALVYLKDQRIIHRDIKLGNLLLQTAVKPNESIVNTGLVLCDFGLAIQLGEREQVVHGTAGTPYYIAREIVVHDGANFASDIWSLGVTLFICLTGRYPFNTENDNSEEIYRKIRRGDYRWRSKEKDRVSRRLRHIVDDMLGKKH
jgi:serine/threonine protein kinase